MSKKLYVDMDGTLARFHDADKTFIEAMWQQDFYIGLKPFQSLVGGLQLFMERNKDIEVHILSALLDTHPPFVESEKRQWLYENLPEIEDARMIFTKAGDDKSAYLNINEDSFLLDDYNKNLSDWQNSGGTAIKFHNDINHKGLGAYGGEKGPLWQGTIIDYNDAYGNICWCLEEIMKTSPIDKDYLNIGDTIETEVEFTDLNHDHLSINKRHIKGVVTEVLGYHAMFDNSQSPVYYSVDTGTETLTIDSEFVGSYSQVNSLIKHFNPYCEVKLTNDEKRLQSFVSNNKLSLQLVNCLDTCFQRYMTLPIRNSSVRMDRVTRWLVSSTNGGVWLSTPVTPRTLNQFFIQMNQRDVELDKLNYSIITAEQKEKYLEKNIYQPSSSNINLDSSFSGLLTDELIETKEQLHQDNEKWRELSGEDYPLLSYGNSSISYKSYSRTGELSKIQQER